MTTGKQPVALEIAELQELAGFAATCAERVLPIFTHAAPDDPRPQEAIAAAKAFAATSKRSNVLRSSGLAAFKAAGQAPTPASAEAAHAATQTVGAAYLHPFYDGLQVKHILGSAAHAIRARELAQDSQLDKEFFDWVVTHAPATLRIVLRRYPPVAAGNNRTGDIMRQLDDALRKE